ncbi:MAG: 16S rRNA (guanine(966)-N(2))-methyltransferase RsmD [bacterium]
MIITSGIYRGIPISAPKGTQTRPTLAKTRQAIFNMIRSYIDGQVVFDFFSGTGALGFEALSNGALKSYFIDQLHGDIIEKNAQKLKVDKTSYAFIKKDFIDAAFTLKCMKQKAGLVFADPPYNKGYIYKLLQALISNNILEPNALVVIELHFDEKKETESKLQNWSIVKEKQYGDTFVLCLKQAEKGV